MPVYIVDADGQVFVSPSQLSEFEYYRDNVFVRRFGEEYGNFGEETTYYGGLGWLNFTGPSFWESDDTDKIEWQTDHWLIKTDGYPRPQLNAINNWWEPWHFRWAKVRGTGVDEEARATVGAVTFGEPMSYDNLWIRIYPTISAIIDYSKIGYPDEHIDKMLFTLDTGAAPINVTDILLAVDNSVFGYPLPGLSHDLDYTLHGIAEDDVRNLHILGHRGGVNWIYVTDVSDIFVEEQLNLSAGMYPINIVTLNDIPYIIGRRYSPPSWYWIYKSGENWVEDLIDNESPTSNYAALDDDGNFFYTVGDKIWKRDIYGTWTVYFSGETIISLWADTNLHIIYKTGNDYYYLQGGETPPGEFIFTADSSIAVEKLVKDGSGNLYFFYIPSGDGLEWFGYKRTTSWAAITPLSVGQEIGYHSVSQVHAIVSSDGIIRFYYTAIPSPDFPNSRHLRIFSFDGVNTSDNLIQMYIYSFDAPMLPKNNIFLATGSKIWRFNNFGV